MTVQLPPMSTSSLGAVVAGAIALFLAACGSTPVPPVGAGGGDADEATVSDAPGSIPMADLPAFGLEGVESEVEVPPALEGPAPRVTSLAEASAASRAGHYTPAETFLRGILDGAEGPRARLALGRILLETGRYVDAAAMARRAARGAARDRDLRVAAETLRGEALGLTGDLDEAERVLTAIAAEAGAHRANVILGRLLQRRGQGPAAEAAFMRLIGAYNDRSIAANDGEGLSYVALAAWGLGSFQDANDAFQEATRADPARVETQVEWAAMFLEKYDAGHAEESLRQAFEHNPDSARAHALMARIRIEQRFDFTAATAYSERALGIDPNLAMAHVTLAGMDLRDMEFTAADAHLDAALSVDAHNLEALSVRAAVRFLADDVSGFEAAKREVLSRNRSFSRMYTLIGEYADWEHRYPEIVAMAREAVTINPRDAFAHATLGLNLLRMGDEENGLASLREAWRRDRFNVHVHNTLNLYDEVIDVEYESFEAAPFTFRMHREERPFLEGLVTPTLVGAYQDMRRRYGFTPEGPLRIELFANPEHFAVRTVGLPRLGVQGVCFGKVVTALSPRAGQFNWGQITWHELAHIFHIQLSRNHVPRWFTEGLAEYETIIARPEWRREEDHHLYRAIATGTLPELRRMNQAFTHAKSQQDVLTAYYASSQIVKFIAEQHGFPDVVAMLRGWGEGRRTPEVIQRALGIDIDQLDRDFRSDALRRMSARAGDFSVDFAAYRDLRAFVDMAQGAPNDMEARAALSAALFAHGERDRAKTEATAAVAGDAANVVAHYVLAAVAMTSREPEAAAEAERHLRAILTAGKDGYDIRLMLAQAAARRQDRAATREHLEAAAHLDGDRSGAWRALLQLADESDDQALRNYALERVATLEQHDRGAWVAWVTSLGERAGTESQWRELAVAAESAQFVAPGSAEVHRLLGQARLELGEPAPALAAFDLALLASPEAPAPIHLGRARALRRLGRRSQARAAADEAVRLDPELAEQARNLGN